MSYTYKAGQWGSIEDKLKTSEDLVHYGFTEYTELDYRIGVLRFYSRNPVPNVTFSFEFLCVLYMNKYGTHGSYRVWISDLPSVLQFLKEIDAHPIVENDSPVDRLISYLRDDTYFAEALEIMYRTLQKQQDGK